MKSLVSPAPLLIACILAVFGLSQSSNALLWMACLFALPVIVWLAGGKKTPSVLLWIVAISWSQVVGDVLYADLVGDSIVNNPAGSARELAIVFSLSALCALALGMRNGNLFGKWVFRTTGEAPAAEELPLDLNRLVACYICLLVIMQVLGVLEQAEPAFLQPVVVIGSLKYVLVYLVAITVLENEQKYFWLIFILALEVMTGVMSFFSYYKESIFIVLIAIASSRRPIRARNIVIAAAALVAVFWLSLVWTTIKREYRTVMFDMSVSQRVDYMADKYFTANIDYRDSFRRLVSRIGYTTLYSKVIEKEQVGSLPDGFDYYKGAVWHVLTPRILFPDKPALDDSKGTVALLGMRIAEGTSIGVGYIAQAHVDFGFPGLLLPIFVIGFLLGVCWQYFTTRPVYHLVGEAFGVAVLFESFLFAANIDKSLGAFFTMWLGLGLILRFGYPAIRYFLAIPSVRPSFSAPRSAI